MQTQFEVFFNTLNVLRLLYQRDVLEEKFFYYYFATNFNVITTIQAEENSTQTCRPRIL